MHLFLVILTLLASLVLIAVILLQNPKGGSGLTSGMSSLGTVQVIEKNTIFYLLSDRRPSSVSR